MNLKLHHLLIALLFITFSATQAVDCIKYGNSTYASVTACQSTTSQTRPINVTSYVKMSKNASWYGSDDWNPYLLRGNNLIYNLKSLSSCFEAQPVKQTLIAGKTYEFSVKCVMLPITLQKGDLVYFQIFEDDRHKVAFLSFMIPIPGYSSEADIKFDEQTKMSLRMQAKNMKKRKNIGFQVDQ